LKLADAGELCLGTVDSWLVWNLAGGKRFVTDFSNASRTQLLNLGQGAWDPELLDLFGVPSSALSQVMGSNELFGEAILGAGRPIPICGILGDSHAALLGHGVLEKGKVKVVPALAGLGAPHWDENARGSIVGLSFGTRKEHILRAALEAIAFQVRDRSKQPAISALVTFELLRR